MGEHFVVFRFLKFFQKKLQTKSLKQLLQWNAIFRFYGHESYTPLYNYKSIEKNGIAYIMTTGNFTDECTLQKHAELR